VMQFVQLYARGEYSVAEHGCLAGARGGLLGRCSRALSQERSNRYSRKTSLKAAAQEAYANDSCSLQPQPQLSLALSLLVLVLEARP
jgi:hypothetical protein